MKTNQENIKNYRPISLLSHMYKSFTRILQTKQNKKKKKTTTTTNKKQKWKGF